jgi:glycine/D-amino acid oxidase-like deaminating enzyme
MRKRIVPVRCVMTAQMPPTEMGKSPFDKQPWTGAHSFVIYPSNSMFVFDYLTQQRAEMDKKAKRPTPQGEIMLGGGFASNTKYIEDVGNVDDRSWNLDTAEYLAGALSKSFKVAGNGDTEQVKSTWSGIIGASSDEMPWIGRVPESVSGRKTPQNGGRREQGMAAPGEWIAAGYSGEGMVHAWSSGRALAEMVGVGGRGSIPEAFRMKEERWKQTGIEDMIARLLIK